MDKSKIMVVSTPTESKTLNYKKGDVSVGFTFRTDIKQEMKDLREILTKAIEDIDVELSKKK